MSAHTKGPWFVSDARPNDYALAIHGAQMDHGGFPVVADVCERTVDGTHQSNAHRIVTCVNACEGLPQDALDGGWTAAGISAYASKLERHNAELLEALQMMVKQFTKTPSSLRDSEARVKAHAAITRATGA